MNAQQIVDLLNEAVKLDKSAMHALVSNRVPATTALRDHPTIEVDDAGMPGYPKVGLMGILNGITRLDGETIATKWELVPDIRVSIDEFTKTGKTREQFVGFVLLPKK